MSKSLRISIADDEIDIRDFLARVLPRLGHEVVSAAANGRELVTDVLRLSPDLVITDVKMPELDGLAAIEEFRRQREVPAIVISAHEEAAASLSQQTSPTLFLTKPINSHSLQMAIGEIVAEAAAS
jgi:response regulator NasT